MTTEMKQLVDKLPLELQDKFIQLETLVRLALAQSVAKGLKALTSAFSEDEDDLVNPEIQALVKDSNDLIEKIDKVFPMAELERLKDNPEFQAYLNS